MMKKCQLFVVVLCVCASPLLANQYSSVRFLNTNLAIRKAAAAALVGVIVLLHTLCMGLEWWVNAKECVFDERLKKVVTKVDK